MKRFILFVSTLQLTLTLNAQVYVGGNVGMSFYRDVTTSSARVESKDYFSIAPEIGYAFNKYFSLGTSVLYQWNESGSQRFAVAPYARFTFAQWEHFGLFVDALFEYSSSYTFPIRLRYNSWQTGLTPGFKIPITPKCGLTTRLAFLGWKKVVDDVVFFPSVNFINSATVGFYQYL